MTKILVADDHPLFRHALRAVISRAQPDMIICEAESLVGASAVLSREQDIAFVLLDLKMSDCGNFDGLLSLRGKYPQTPIIVVTADGDPATVANALALGAAGFISKSSTRAEIEQAVKTILAGEIWAPAHGAAAPVSKDVQSLGTLSAMQLRILMGLRRGLQNKEIAYEIGITEKTVKAYLTKLFRKLGATNRTQALICVQRLMPKLH